jgi:hypothetical protein
MTATLTQVREVTTPYRIPARCGATGLSICHGLCSVLRVENPVALMLG